MNRHRAHEHLRVSRSFTALVLIRLWQSLQCGANEEIGRAMPKIGPKRRPGTLRQLRKKVPHLDARDGGFGEGAGAGGAERAEAIPLCIGVSWGMIIYTAMETSDRFALPWYLRPILDALLALTIDLSMDAIAIRLGFWTWGQAGPWFGVPLGNFYAWLIVVLGFSLLLRLGRLWSLAGPLALFGDVTVAILAILLSVVGLSTLLRPAYALIAQGAWAWLIIGALLAIWAAWRTRRDQPLDLVLLSVPLFFHVFSFGALFVSGMYRQVQALIAISALMLAVGMLLHLWASRIRLFQSSAMPPVTQAG